MLRFTISTNVKKDAEQPYTTKIFYYSLHKINLFLFKCQTNTLYFFGLPVFPTAIYAIVRSLWYSKTDNSYIFPFTSTFGLRYNNRCWIEPIEDWVLNTPCLFSLLVC